MIIHPVCVGCKVAYRPLRNGVYLIEMAWTPPTPANIIAADLLECPGCQHQIVSGFAKQGKEHYEEGFKHMLNAIPADKKIPVYERPR